MRSECSHGIFHAFEHCAAFLVGVILGDVVVLGDVALGEKNLDFCRWNRHEWFRFGNRLVGRDFLRCFLVVDRLLFGLFRGRGFLFQYHLVFMDFLVRNFLFTRWLGFRNDFRFGHSPFSINFFNFSIFGDRLGFRSAARLGLIVELLWNFLVHRNSPCEIGLMIYTSTDRLFITLFIIDSIR